MLTYSCIAGSKHDTVSNGIAVALFGLQDETTHISNSTKDHLKLKFPPDSDISSQMAIYRFTETESANQNASSKSGKLLTNQIGTGRVIQRDADDVSTNQMGSGNINFGNNLNADVDALNVRTKSHIIPEVTPSHSRNAIHTKTRMLRSNDNFIYPQDVVNKRENSDAALYVPSGSKKASRKNPFKHPTEANYVNNVNSYPRHTTTKSNRNGKYAIRTGTEKVPTLLNNYNSHPRRSQGPATLATRNKNAEDKDFKNGFQGVYVRQDNADTAYDPITSEISYLYETATKTVPHRGCGTRKRTEDSINYQNEMANDREVLNELLKQTQGPHYLPASKNIIEPLYVVSCF